MAKKLVMHLDPTYTTSAVYGFEWVEDGQIQGVADLAKQLLGFADGRGFLKRLLGWS
jgi:hypothetical protein